MGNALQTRANRLIWATIVAVGIIDAVWLFIIKLPLNWRSAMLVFWMLGGCFILSVIYGRWRRDERLWLLSQVAAQLICSTGVLGVLSYVTARLNLPLLDKKLIDIDHSFGFDWFMYIAWIDMHPWLADLCTLAYQSSGPQVIIVTLLLFACNKMEHLQRLIVAFLSCALITIVLAALFPAVAGYVHYHTILSNYPNLHPAAERLHEAPLMAMRAHELEPLSFPLQGLVTFPSFHSTMAVLMVFAMWPLRYFLLIFIPLNVLVLMSVPVDGGHYLIDLIGGLLVVIPGIKLAYLLLPGEPLPPEDEEEDD